MRSARSFISTVAAFSAAQNKADRGMCEFSTLIIVFIRVWEFVMFLFTFFF